MTEDGRWSAQVSAWRDRGRRVQLAGHEIFVVDLPAGEAGDAEPLLVLHGFPTSSFDFHLVAERLSHRRRVVIPDLVGFGLSAKPDLRYSVELHADVVAALTAELGLERLALLTHDIGDTIGGELLARQGEGRWPADVTQRVLTNGSVYMDLVQLSVGQRLLLDLPDARLAPELAPDADAVAGSLRATFAPGATVPDDELAWAYELMAHDGGNTLLARTIRYVEDRRRNETRYTGALEEHPSPLAIVWGPEDPIAVPAMAERLQERRPDATLQLLPGVGHYPMLEAPDAFADAVVESLG